MKKILKDLLPKLIFFLIVSIVVIIILFSTNDIQSVFSEIGNSEWRLSTHTLFATSHTTPKDFIDMITSIPLSTLETK